MGDKIVLRPITEDDAPAMFAALADREMLRLTGSQQTFTYDAVQQFCRRVMSADDRADYAITLKGDPTYMGEVVLNNIDWLNRTANFRIALGQQALLGLGYGTEATRLILDYGFRSLNLHRIELEVYEFNPRAQRVYEKVGFVREGVRRDVLLWEGQYYNAITMSILEEEYRRLA